MSKLNEILFYFFSNFTKEKIKHFFSCDNLNEYFTQLLLVVLFWGTLWGVFGETAAPGGHLFNIMLIGVSAYLCGKLFQLFNLPKMLGMLIIGFMLGNNFIINSTLVLDEDVTKSLRRIALVIVLLRAGLELEPDHLYQFPILCFNLSLVPCIVETLTIVFLSHMMLEFPIDWGFLLGFLLAAVSPAVLIPPLLSLKERGLGVDKDIPTLLLAAAGIDDILAITAFGLCTKVIFYKNVDPIYWLFKVPVEPLIGIMVGILIGLILWYIPSEQSLEALRFLLLFFGGLSAYVVLKSYDMRAAGPEACFVAAFSASFQWRYDRLHKRIKNDLKEFWVIFQPFLFGLIGAEVKFKEFSDDIRSEVLIICCGLLTRFLATLLVTVGNGLNKQEKVFIAFAWLPKATFQAAFAPMVLELAKEKDQDIPNAKRVMAMSFIAVILSAPLGAIAISILGPIILKKSKQIAIKEEKDSEISNVL